MSDFPSLDDLTKRLGELNSKQQQFQQEITELQRQLYELRRGALKDVPESELTVEIKKDKAPVEKPAVVEETAAKPAAVVTEAVNIPPFQASSKKSTKEKTPIEEFIGTNLLNKIGIAILVIGVGIGTQYAIDHSLIQPITRIILGYVACLALIGLAIRLKPKYQNFSAVLLSGGMAVLYFITFAAYDLYGFIPQAMAFVLMVVFTAFTVFAALKYDMRVIAIIGLVGAYGVPFLLSDGSGRVAILLSYMSIINVGILVLAFKKDWKQLYYVAFALSWLIFGSWHSFGDDADEHLAISLIFGTLFFCTFYAMILAYKLIRSEALTRWDVIILSLNSVIYFGIGYDALDSFEQGDAYLGAFTVFTALLHFIACFLIYKRQGHSKDVFYLVAGFVLVFLTLAVPVQLDGNWVTLVWAGEGALLFWIGRSKGFRTYEILSYPIVVLAAISLVEDWTEFYRTFVKSDSTTYVRPFFNIQFVGSLLTCAALGFITWFNSRPNYTRPFKEDSAGNRLVQVGLPGLLLILLYFSGHVEVDNYWYQRVIDSQLRPAENEVVYHEDYDLQSFWHLWMLYYAAIFTVAVAAINHWRIRNRTLSIITSGFGTILLFIFITVGLVNIAALRNSYLNPVDSEYYIRDSGHLMIRYVGILLMLPLLWFNYVNTRTPDTPENYKKGERVFFHVVVLALLSSELVGLLALLRVEGSDRLALSILWGVYALALIVFGLMKDLKYLRIAAITLFGITIIKLFFYDLSGMGTIAKTLVMIVLGALMLVASFLYNKFKKSGHAES